MKMIHYLLILLALALCAIPFRAALRRPVAALIQRTRGRKSVRDRVEQFGPTVQTRLSPLFERIGEEYPPQQMGVVGLKQERRLEVWVADPPKLLKSYPILGASGTLGPKLKEGDYQVPEGLYRIESLNPNSLYHLALRVNYPNQFDKRKGDVDGRHDLGGDIMIHGKNCSVGCLAMGDAAAEELFVLAAATGLDHISVILAPLDFRTSELPPQFPGRPAWAPELYAPIRQALMQLKQRPPIARDEAR